jgi:hypothetical protein
VFAIIQAVGWPIWPLILASVIAVALIIERSITLRRARIVPPGLLENVLADLRQGGVSAQMIERVGRTRRLDACLPPVCATSTARAR